MSNQTATYVSLIFLVTSSLLCPMQSHIAFHKSQRNRSMNIVDYKYCSCSRRPEQSVHARQAEMMYILICSRLYIHRQSIPRPRPSLLYWPIVYHTYVAVLAVTQWLSLHCMPNLHCLVYGYLLSVQFAQIYYGYLASFACLLLYACMFNLLCITRITVFIFPNISSLYCLGSLHSYQLRFLPIACMPSLLYTYIMLSTMLKQSSKYPIQQLTLLVVCYTMVFFVQLDFYIIVRHHY